MIERPAHPPRPAATRPAPGRRARAVRVAAMAAVLLVALVVGRALGIGSRHSAEVLRDAIQAAGALGVALYLVAFCAGSLLYVPGLLFVLAAVAAYGRVPGTLLAYAGALTSVIVSFLVVRAAGGRLLAEIGNPRLQRMLGRLERRPIATVVLLRLVFFMGAPLNYALALSTVTLRDYALGSAIGLVVPVAASASLFHFLLWW